MPSVLQQTLAQLLLGNVPTATLAAWPPMQWQQIGQHAHQEGVAPVLARALTATHCREYLPPALWAQLHGSYLATLAENRLRYAALVRLLAQLPATQLAAPLPLILLKGSALALTVYPDVGLRRMSDLDLLVLPSLRTDLLRVCQQAGLQRVAMQPGIEQITGQVQLSGDSYLLAMDLHWHLIAGEADRRAPALDWFSTQTAPLTLPDSTITVQHFTPTAHLLYLAAHLMLRHAGTHLHLRWLYDLHLLISHHPIDWQLLYRQAAACGWLASLHAALTATHALFATPVPAGYLHGLAEHIPTSRDYASVYTSQSLPATQTARAWQQFAGLTWSGRLHLLGALLFPTPEYLIWRYPLHLPPSLRLLYYPYRWLDILRDGAQTVAQLAATYWSKKEPVQ